MQAAPRTRGAGTKYLAVHGLGARPRAVRPGAGGPVVSDGPCLEAREHVGSYVVLDVGSEERALEIVASGPGADRRAPRCAARLER